MTKIIQPALATIFRSVPRLRAGVLAVAGTCYCLTLAPTAGAESQASQPAPDGVLSVRNANVMAVYDGGSITAAHAAEYVGEPHFLADAEQNAPTNAMSLDENTARHVASLLNKCHFIFDPVAASVPRSGVAAGKADHQP